MYTNIGGYMKVRDWLQYIAKELEPYKQLDIYRDRFRSRKGKVTLADTLDRVLLSIGYVDQDMVLVDDDVLQ